MVKTGKYVYLERDKGGNRNHKIIIKGGPAEIGQVASRCSLGLAFVSPSPSK